MTELKPISGLYAIEVSDTSEDFIINEGWLEYVDLSRKEYEGNVWVALTEDPYEILFTTKNCSEEQAAGVFPVIDVLAVCVYKNYNKSEGGDFFWNAIDSLQSLLRANGLSTDKNYLLIKSTPKKQ